MSPRSAEYDGGCAFAVSVGKTNVQGSPKYSLEIDGKTYYFLNPVAKLLFRILPGRREKADMHWKASKK